jgi:hypothetical protein
MTYVQETTKIVGTGTGDPEPSAELAQGHSVAINADDGTWLVTGNPTTDGAQGEAYIFRWDSGSWQEHKILLAPSSGATFPQFGFSVAISADGHRVIVGAPGGSAGDVVGTVYVYDYDSGLDDWFEADFFDSSAGLGWSVALSHDGLVAAVASHYDDATLIYRDGGGFTLEDTVAGGDAATISGDGSTVFVLSSGGDGAIYFNDGGWSEQTTVNDVIDWPQGTVPFALSYIDTGVLSDPTIGEGRVFFGASVSITGDGVRVAVGAPDDGNSGSPDFATYGASWVFVGSVITTLSVSIGSRFPRT